MAVVEEWHFTLDLSRTMVALRPRAIWSIGPGPQNACLNKKIRYHWPLGVFRFSSNIFWSFFIVW